ncbi:MAG: hypothetical protein ACI9U2_000328 [Bradymonadia bacterium]|jgi:hypothetical protein
MERDHVSIDVFAGAMVGAEIGVFVPHVHRTLKVRIAATPTGAMVGCAFSRQRAKPLASHH